MKENKKQNKTRKAEETKFPQWNKHFGRTTRWKKETEHFQTCY